MWRAAEGSRFIVGSGAAHEDGAMRYVLALLIPLAGCATISGEREPVALEQVQRVGPLRITPVNLIEDSRCPQNARCIWAGRVVIRARIDDGHGQLERNLTLGQPAEVGGRQVMLDSVTPERNAGSEVSVAAYRFHFSVVSR